MAHIISYVNHTNTASQTSGASYPQEDAKLRDNAILAQSARHNAWNNISVLADGNEPPAKVNMDDISYQSGPLHAAQYDVQGEILICPAKSLIGLTVMGQRDSAVLGQVSDLIFDHENNQLAALVLGQSNVFDLSEAQIVPWREIIELGDDVIYVENTASKMRLHDDECLSMVSRKVGALLPSGSNLLMGDADNSVTLGDMCIDEISGDVLGYEVGEDFIDVSLRDKSFLPAPAMFNLR